MFNATPEIRCICGNRLWPPGPRAWDFLISRGKAGGTKKQFVCQPPLPQSHGLWPSFGQCFCRRATLSPPGSRCTHPALRIRQAAAEKHQELVGPWSTPPFRGPLTTCARNSRLVSVPECGSIFASRSYSTWQAWRKHAQVCVQAPPTVLTLPYSAGNTHFSCTCHNGDSYHWRITSLACEKYSSHQYKVCAKPNLEALMFSLTNSWLLAVGYSSLRYRDGTGERPQPLAGYRPI